MIFEYAKVKDHLCAQSISTILRKKDLSTVNKKFASLSTRKYYKLSKSFDKNIVKTSLACIQQLLKVHITAGVDPKKQ
jgi:hypothetical protein